MKRQQVQEVGRHDHLWRNVKQSKTPHRYVPTFAALVKAVNTGLAYVTTHPAEVRQEMSTYLAEKAACPLMT